ncbi:MAG: hypothetical protein U0992_21910 [Planctomycetaceae bacterium]
MASASMFDAKFNCKPTHSPLVSRRVARDPEYSVAVRRGFLRPLARISPAPGHPFLASAGTGSSAHPVTHEIAAGDLRVLFRDNTDSPKQLSGLDSLFHASAPDFDAYDPDDRGASAGLNFEHIISGHQNPNNAFTPRKGPFRMTVLQDGKSVRLTRKTEDDPWAMSKRAGNTVTPPRPSLWTSAACRMMRRCLASADMPCCSSRTI